MKFPLPISWIMISAGFYTYESAGLGYAFIPFLVAAFLRGDRDKKVSDMLLHRRPWGIAVAAYYLLLLFFVLLQPKRFSEASGAVLALVLTLPFVGMALWNDIAECREKIGSK